MSKKKKPKRKPRYHRGRCGCGFVCTAVTEVALAAAIQEHDGYMGWKLGHNGGVDVGAGQDFTVIACGTCSSVFDSMDAMIAHLGEVHGL